MSLLMDALRKAEADKKQASADDSQAPTREYTAPVDEPAEDAGATYRPADPKESAAPDPRDGMSLEPLEPDLRQSSAAEPDADSSLSSTDDALGVRPIAPDPLASISDVERKLESVLDRSQSGPRPRLRPSLPDSEIVTQRTDSGLRETVAGAHTIFEAGSGGPSKVAVLWSVAAAIVLLFLLGGAGLYYFQQTPTPRVIPSPKVAIDVEKPWPREPLETAIKVELPETTAEQMTAPANFVSPLTQEQTSERSGVVEQSPAAPAQREAVSSAAIANTETTDSTARDVDAAPRAAEPAPRTPSLTMQQTGVRFGEVRIARSIGADSSDALVNQAYAAYVAGEYAAAEALYRRVLKLNPKHRDALLGAAALSLRAGDVAAAHRLYRNVLAGEPDNPTASAALFSIEGGIGDQVTESRLKMLLDEGVDVGFVYFSLGNLYARNKRWADAQQAYFEALRNNPSNPDYNYNLAVSLDRIGQRSAAVKYYAAAIELTDGVQPGFDTASALTRINAINADPAH